MPFERNKELFPLKTHMTLESFRGDANHDMWNAIQGQRLPDDVRIGGQPVLPEGVTNNHDGGSRRWLISLSSRRARFGGRDEMPHRFVLRPFTFLTARR